MPNFNDNYLARAAANMALKKGVNTGINWGAGKLADALPKGVGGQLGNLASLYAIYDVMKNKNPVGAMQLIAQHGIPKMLASSGMAPAGSVMGMSGFALPFAFGTAMNAYLDNRDKQYQKKDVDDWKRDATKYAAQGKALPFSRNMYKQHNVLDEDTQKAFRNNAYDSFKKYTASNPDWWKNAANGDDPDSYFEKLTTEHGLGYDEYLRNFKMGRVDIKGRPIGDYQVGSDVNWDLYTNQRKYAPTFAREATPYNYDYLGNNLKAVGKSPVSSGSGNWDSYLSRVNEKRNNTYYQDGVEYSALSEPYERSGG